VRKGEPSTEFFVTQAIFTYKAVSTSLLKLYDSLKTDTAEYATRMGKQCMNMKFGLGNMERTVEFRITSGEMYVTLDELADKLRT
jgi:hypothetical protein